MSKLRRLILLRGFRFNTSFKKYMYILSAFLFMATMIWIDVSVFSLGRVGMVKVCALCTFIIVRTIFKTLDTLLLVIEYIIRDS